MVKDLYGLKTEGYDVADDADSVLGPVDAAQTRTLLRGVGDNRDADGNIAFPGRFAYRDNGLPSIDSPKPPEAPKEGSSWPTKNEDGSYQLAPGAKLKFAPLPEQMVDDYTQGITAGAGGLLGGALGSLAGAPLFGAVAGGSIGAMSGGMVKEVLKKIDFPSVEIGGGNTSPMNAPDFPNNNRNDD